MNVCSAACGFCGACESGSARVELTCKRCGHGFDIVVDDWPEGPPHWPLCGTCYQQALATQERKAVSAAFTAHDQFLERR